MTAQRARGTAHLSVRHHLGRSKIADLAMAGSTKLLFPRASFDGLDVVYLNSAGGITGGDRFALSIEVQDGARLRGTTQAAERAYRAPDGPSGTVSTTLRVDKGASLLWLPQETILYDGAALSRKLAIDLAPAARYLGCETVIFGRQAMGERLSYLRFRDDVDLRQNGDLVFADRLRLEGNADAALARCGVANGAGAMASILWVAPGARSQSDALRATLPAQAGLSALRDDLLFIRMLAPDSLALRRSLVPLLERLAGQSLPRPWML